MRRMLSLAVLALSLAGCANLKLEVEVLDPMVVRNMANDDRVRKELPNIVGESEQALKGRVDDLSNAHYREYLKARDDLLLQASKLPANSPDRARLETVAESFNEFPFGDMYTKSRAALLTNRDKLAKAWDAYKDAPDEVSQIREARARLSKDDRESTRSDYATLSAATDKGKARNTLIVALDERKSLETNLAALADRDIAELRGNVKQALTDQGLPEGKAIAASSQIAKQGVENVARQSQLFYNGGLPLSPYAFYVASAPEDSWAEKYDRSKAKGLFGNTDIAIKALGEGNYTLKGVSFNPADVAAAASKVATQMVLLAAQIGGVPVKLSSSTQSAIPDTANTPAGSALAQSSNRLATALEQDGVVSEKIAAQQDALLRIAAAILREKKDIEGSSGEQLKAAIAAIKASYESHAPRLTISTTAEGKAP